MSSQAKAFILSCLFSAIAADKSQEIRGVSLKKLDLYKPLPGNKFACFNDSKSQYDFSVVNDDYCDCEDGSDEPGTSACSNMKFTCNNKGFKPAKILSSRVNDGVCDPECCDGTDEYDGKIKCPDICAKVAEDSSKGEKAYREMVEKCLEIKRGYVGQYAAFKKTTQEKIASLNEQIAEKKEKIEDLRM
ncbi:hypothetical protein DSO57_1001698 [Entomophthora muscae]|uniref:Uncharacterized protein n=1 Tax=Entomophthora muscae TaxID=34485 RepID=A0ACC2SLL9_9FUNG|nr:hypothetical protein DSO57_1001698 [Entomophthora muscae]